MKSTSSKSPLQYISSNCAHPQNLTIKGVKYSLPCGVCSWCRHKTSRNLSSMLKLYSSNRYCLFFTLTYADECLPLFKVDKDFNFYIQDRLYHSYARFTDVRPSSSSSASDRESYLKKRDSFNSSVTFSPIQIFNDSYIYEKARSKFQRDLKTVRNIDSSSFEEAFPFLYYRDVQNFFKKLRRELDEDFTYSVTCEYGGRNHRPHYHVLLFYRRKSEYDISFIQDCLCKCWGKSSSDSYDIKRPDRVDGVLSDYLTTYVNTFVGASSHTLRDLLVKLPPFRQKTRHSSKMLRSYVETNRDLFYRDPRSFFLGGIPVLPDSFEYRKLPFSSYSLLCPKPYDFGRNSSLYNLSLFLSSRTDNLSVTRMIDLLSFSHSSNLIHPVFSSLGIQISDSFVSYPYSHFLHNNINFSRFIYGFTDSLSQKVIDLLFRVDFSKEANFYDISSGVISLTSSSVLFLVDSLQLFKYEPKGFLRLYRFLKRFSKCIERFYLYKKTEINTDALYINLSVILKFFNRLFVWNYRSINFLSKVMPYFSSYSSYLSFCNNFYSFVENNRLKEFYSNLEIDPSLIRSFYFNSSDYDPSPILAYQSDVLNLSNQTKLHNSKHLNFDV